VLSLNLINQIAEKGDKVGKNIGIGIGDYPESNIHIFKAAQQMGKDYERLKFHLIGKRTNIMNLFSHLKKKKIISLEILEKFKGIEDSGSKEIEEITNENSIKLEITSLITFYITKSPEKFLLGNLSHDRSKNQLNIPNLDAIIRGSLSSSKFLKELRKAENEEKKTYRLALLETFDGHQFFYAPVGIDEANSMESKERFIEGTIELYKKTGLKAKIALLSGGRAGDIGRDESVDNLIRQTDSLAKKMQNKYPNQEINHEYILIETAIHKGSNTIIAPEGVSGNLIYRTLVHLGGGRAYGALYLDHFLREGRIILDTSRVAEKSEYIGAIKLAYYLN